MLQMLLKIIQCFMRVPLWLIYKSIIHGFQLRISALNLIATLLLPHFKSIMKLSFSSLITGVLDAVRKQVSFNLKWFNCRNQLNIMES